MSVDMVIMLTIYIGYFAEHTGTFSLITLLSCQCAVVFFRALQRLSSAVVNFQLMLLIPITMAMPAAELCIVRISSDIYV